MQNDQIHELYNAFFQRMALVARTYVTDIEIARDLVQDVFVHLIKKNPQEITNPEAYLFTATRRKCLDHIRQANIRGAHDQTIAHEYSDHFFEDAMEKAELESYLMSLIEELPEKRKQIFKESRFSGKSNDEIASELNLSKRTVETQISQALKHIREGLDEFRLMMLSLL